MQEGINNLFAGAVFLAGVLSFFSPCVFPLLPVYLGKLAEDPGTRSFSFFGLKVYVSPLVKTVFFITGLSTVFFSLGFGTGLHQMELININFLQRQKKIELDGKRQGGILGAFLLGLTFSFGWTPCVGPVLGAVLAVVASENGSALYGGLLMAVYAAGMAVPFLILAVASSWLLKYSSHVKRHMVLLKKIGGVLIILMGILLMLGKLDMLAAVIS